MPVVGDDAAAGDAAVAGDTGADDDDPAASVFGGDGDAAGLGGGGLFP